MGRKLGLESMVWTRRKKETSNQKRMKKQEFKQNITRDIEIKNIVTIARGEWGGDSAESSL